MEKHHEALGMHVPQGFLILLLVARAFPAGLFHQRNLHVLITHCLQTFSRRFNALRTQQVGIIPINNRAICSRPIHNFHHHFRVQFHWIKNLSGSPRSDILVSLRVSRCTSGSWQSFSGRTRGRVHRDHLEGMGFYCSPLSLHPFIVCQNISFLSIHKRSMLTKLCYHVTIRCDGNVTQA